jgi:hypothetical protein
MSRLELRPAFRSDVRYLDVIIDGRLLATYFAGRLGALPEQISPFGSAKDARVNNEVVQRFLLEREPDLPEGRNSLLICQLCGDLNCGAYSAVFEKQGDYLIWSQFGYEQPNWETGSQDVACYPGLGEFRFLWEQYSSELKKNGDV